MQITLSPSRGLPGQPETALSVAGDVLTVDGVPYDLSAVPEGGTATPEGGDHPFEGVIYRTGGVVTCRIRVLLDETAAPDQPDGPMTITQSAGDITIPALRNPEPEGIA